MRGGNKKKNNTGCKYMYLLHIKENKQERAKEHKLKLTNRKSVFWYHRPTFITSISPCVFSPLPLPSFCFPPVEFSRSPTFGTTSGSGRFTLFPSPAQAVLSHSISLTRSSASLTYTQAHVALLRFCLRLPTQKPL